MFKEHIKFHRGCLGIAYFPKGGPRGERQHWQSPPGRFAGDGTGHWRPRGTAGTGSSGLAVHTGRQARRLPPIGITRQRRQQEVQGAPLPCRTGAKGTLMDGQEGGRGSTLESEVMGLDGEREALTFPDKAEEGGIVAGSSQGKVEDVGNLGDNSSAESGGDRCMGHIFDWSEEEAPGLEDDGITMKVRPPMRIYERRWGGANVGSPGGVDSSDSEGAGPGEEVGGQGRGWGQSVVSMLTDTLGLLQRERSVSLDGDPGGPVAAPAPW
ncbi:hypothetical protein NDU88_002875 [Pleurodeles waltl]|uniref:Uncharacterized protein n=1 Tax=Pleurodeles waltl TaxID=8319 RepID=A0AAV7NIA5_PLEWA|nr:hypothetical protein NDU88_002875 [Pleurodeles waltl]